MNTNMVTKMDANTENTLQRHEIELVELKTRIDYKHERIDELKNKIEAIDKKLDKIDHCLSELKLQSERDDFNIDNRVTKLENTQNVLKWITAIGLTAITTSIAILTFLLTNIH